MIPDLDIYRSAQVLVKQHGQDAPIHAAMRAEAAYSSQELVWPAPLCRTAMFTKTDN